MFYPRKIYPELVAHLDKKPATLLTGMHRTGKTTLVKHLNDAYEAKETPAYYDLENLKKTASRINLRTYYVVGKFQPANLFNEFIWGGNII